MHAYAFFQRILRLVLVAAFLSAGMAMAQAEPTMAEVYATAQAGKIDQAQVMVQQVLVGHPNSAKAHFVQSELYARQGNVARAREALATAEKLAPGLPFAKPEAVQALRAQLASTNVPARTSAAAAAVYSTPATGMSGGTTGSGWMLPVLLAGGAIVLGYLVFRRKSQPAYGTPAATYGGSVGNGMQGGTYGYGQPGYPQQPAGSGLGGRIMGGVATGLAVGAGVMAAEAIGKSLMGNHDQGGHAIDNSAGNAYQPLAGNADMGGQDFGISDSSSWDSGGSDSGGGSDWDN